MAHIRPSFIMAAEYRLAQNNLVNKNEYIV